MTQKVCFLLRIDPAATGEYVDRHDRIWPEMLEALHESGYRNYSMFLDPTGLLVGYLETDDFAASSSRMAAHPVQQRWSDSMEAMFLPVDQARPVGTIAPLRHVFDLDRQRATMPEGAA
ncbi:L-rhamnose mutarotase [Leifsonia shinshuensis]|uniref:L-rhamnose mutarotase n=1 Tax=Leifsonia shinshuensis TaxID=150026 RepID=UPI001F50A116|nr:L-rhamnose mutarotase [Leifsonia shinshuensis]MCI0159392.1 L-rhamnose mutarotase [Leifsonia shinshuensis]